MTEKSKICFCPNCNQPAMRTGNEIACETCDAIYKITKTGEAKVKKIGPLEDHEQRLQKLESMIGQDEPEPKEDQAEPDEPEIDEDDDEEILPR